MHNLVVIRPFGSYRIGDIVTDVEVIETILGSEHSAHVVRIQPPSGE